MDDEPLAISRFTFFAEQIKDLEYKCFIRVDEACEYCSTTKIDMAFLDIEMPLMNGIELAKKLKIIDQNIKIVFITAHSNFALEAFEIDAIGYVTKPFNLERIEKEIGKASLIKNITDKMVVISTMPRFDIFLNGKAMVFSSQKAKELLALIVDRNGGEVSSEYAITYLWENRNYDKATKTLYRVVKKSLLDSLKANDIDYIIGKDGNKLYCNVDKVECDYFKILQNDVGYYNKFNGQYMFEYSWAEETCNRLIKMLDI